MGEGRSDGCRVHDEGGAGGDEELPSSSEDDEDHIVHLLVPGKRTRTPNTLFFNDNFA